MTSHHEAGAPAFVAVVELAGKSATGVRVPADVVEALGAGRQPLVRVTINAHTYPSKVAVRGGEYRLPISAANRDAAGVVAGDRIEVRLAVDAEPRVLVVPEDLDAALDAEPDARRCFDGLSYSRRQWFVLSVEGAKTDATRRRRVTQAVERLAGG